MQEPTSDLFQIPEKFLCPITKRLLRNPVATINGQVYEEEIIKKWARINSR